ncbi:hypothetical protein [Kribbella monticola]|uniref:hypothetical protein n=1 Tax=Kribbella monticola TaxID=2185285 RepID=UPI000DD4B771|nr:hypothetical protein [Kribbella monticola]
MTGDYVLGTGPDAVRVRLSESGVQLRTVRRIIDGNGDMAVLVGWLLEHAPGSLPQIERTVGCSPSDLFALLGRLAAVGVPVIAWGPDWQRAAGEFAGEGGERDD